ncbi:sulfide:quinone reductase [bacterium]|nr:sulfide:quinone reductase [bacterium]
MKTKQAKQISDLFNSTSINPKIVGVELSTDHRYLQQEMFKSCLAFVACLANNYRKGYYDGRNEFACKCADIMMAQLENSDLYFKEFEDKQYEEILKESY